MAEKKKRERLPAAVNVDYRKARAMYVHKGMSCSEIAKALGCTPDSIRKKAKEEYWDLFRKDFNDKVAEMVDERMAQRRAETMEKFCTSIDRAVQVGLEAMEDPRQFHRHLVSEGKDGNFHTEEKEFDKLDSRAFRDMSQSFRDLEPIVRRVTNNPTEEELERRQIARERFELEKQKVAQGEPDKEIVVRFVSANGADEDSEGNHFGDLTK